MYFVRCEQNDALEYCSKVYYDWTCLVIDAVRCRHLRLLGVVDDDLVEIQHCRCLGLEYFHCLGIRLPVEFVWSERHILLLVAPHIAMICDRRQASLGNAANGDILLDIANSDYMIFLMEHCRWRHHYTKLMTDWNETKVELVLFSHEIWWRVINLRCFWHPSTFSGQSHEWACSL